MRFFALQTDKQKIIKDFCSKDEDVIYMTYYHGLSFLFAIIREIIITIIVFAFAIMGVLFDWPLLWLLAILFSLWFIFVFFNALKAYIDWSYDMIVITTDKVILIDQTSFLRQEIKPISLENIGSITTRTQFGNIFNFGQIVIDLKEGEGGKNIKLFYVPSAEEVAAKISDAVTRFQRKYHQ